MSWLQKLLPPKINRTGAGAKKNVPEGLWSKCPSCAAVLYATDLEKNANVCPKCGYHNRISARGRLDLLLDPEGDRKSTRLNSSHLVISYAVFCLKKKKNITD